MTHNVHALALGWYFITSSPQTKPIEKLKMKITTKAQFIMSLNSAFKAKAIDI